MLIMKSDGPCYMKQGVPDFQQMHKEDLLPLTALSREQHPLCLQIRLYLLGLQPHWSQATLERCQPMVSSRNEMGESNIFHIRARTPGGRGAVKKEVLPWQRKDLPPFPSLFVGPGTLQAPRETNKQVSARSEIPVIVFLTAIAQPDGRLVGGAWCNSFLVPTTFPRKSGKAAIWFMHPFPPPSTCKVVCSCFTTGYIRFPTIFQF